MDVSSRRMITPLSRSGKLVKPRPGQGPSVQRSESICVGSNGTIPCCHVSGVSIEGKPLFFAFNRKPAASHATCQQLSRLRFTLLVTNSLPKARAAVKGAPCNAGDQQIKQGMRSFSLVILRRPRSLVAVSFFNFQIVFAPTATVHCLGGQRNCHFFFFLHRAC